jgi:2-oxoglutarate dehydrogenase E1 component
VIDAGWVEARVAEFTAVLENEFEAAKTYLPNKADWFEGRWTGLGRPDTPETERRNVATGIDEAAFHEVGHIITAIPEDLTPHKTLTRIVEARRQMVESGEGFDWATAEALAFGTLVREGFQVRLSGQDSGRGTFSQRHSVWVDQQDGHKYIPLCNVGSGRFEVRDSPLSEFGVLGFEYGYALSDPRTLVLWEAQFGDFANGAQVIIDQFISPGESKWLRANGLVMLLPHGYEGQGPEHSSARPERYLQLCAEDNMQVANLTTPANYFHVLRRQMHRDFRDSHFKRILSDVNGPADEQVKRLVLCSGKIAYELMEARDKAGDGQTSIVRLEQLYPFPSEPLVIRLKRMANLEEVVWAQEEPKNNGYWNFVEPFLEECLGEAGVRPRRPVYAGRASSASPATGLAKRHAAEQAALIAAALGHGSEATPQRRAG